MISHNPEVALKMIESSNQQAARSASVLRTLLLTQTPEAEISKQIVLSALQQQQLSPFAMLGMSQPVGAGGVDGAISASMGVPALAAIPPLQTSAEPFPISPPTIGYNPYAVSQGQASLPATQGSTAQSVDPGQLPGINPFPSPDPGLMSNTPTAAVSNATGIAEAAAIVARELPGLNSIAGVEVQQLGASGGDYRLEITIDGHITFRVRIGADFDVVGPGVDYVIVGNMLQKPATNPGLLPPWEPGMASGCSCHTGA